jgi:DNA-binding NtrC family response regulator
MKAGGFREDLYHRLAVFSLPIPSLAERKEDIEDLAAAFVQFFATRTRKPVTRLSAGALELLLGYGYPGNVRELRNIVERGVILAAGEEITEREIMLPEGESSTVPESDFFHVEFDQAGRPRLWKPSGGRTWPGSWSTTGDVVLSRWRPCRSPTPDVSQAHARARARQTEMNPGRSTRLAPLDDAAA